MNNKNNIHTISLLVANKPGVLIRCAQIFARRGFNIDSLVVSPAVNEKFSRMTITAQGDPETLEQIIKQSAKLIDVVHAEEHTGLDSVDREYALFKVRCKTAAQKTAIQKIIRGKAHIEDSSEGFLIIGQSGTTFELDKMEDKLKEYKIIEMVRSGKLVMAKGRDET